MAWSVTRGVLNNYLAVVRPDSRIGLECGLVCDQGCLKQLPIYLQVVRPDAGKISDSQDEADGIEDV